MNILVLGGNGYLGSKIVRKLIEKNHSVTCTKRENSDLSRLGEEAEKIKWINASIEAVEAEARDRTFDYVINTVCNYGRCGVLYDNIINANLSFPLDVLNVTVGTGTKQFITMGTGLPQELNMYSFSKKIFEEFGRYYVDKHGIDFVSLQLEMFYGYDEPKNRFLPSVITKMINGETVETTLGTQKRDIIAIEDVVNAVMAVINNTPSGYTQISVGTGTAPAVSEIIDYIWCETGKKSCVCKGAVPMRDNEPDCVADVSEIKKLCDWNPIFWKDGIKQMIESIEKTESKL